MVRRRVGVGRCLTSCVVVGRLNGVVATDGTRKGDRFGLGECSRATHDTGAKFGMRPQISKAVANQAVVMMPNSRMVSESFSLHRYALGKDIPQNST